MCGRRWADEWVCLCVSEGGGVYVCMRVFFSDVKYIQTFFFLCTHLYVPLNLCRHQYKHHTKKNPDEQTEWGE